MNIKILSHDYATDTTTANVEGEVKEFTGFQLLEWAEEHNPNLHLFLCTEVEDEQEDLVGCSF